MKDKEKKKKKCVNIHSKWKHEKDYRYFIDSLICGIYIKLYGKTTFYKVLKEMGGKEA